MARRKRIISVPRGHVDKIAKAMRCTPSAVYNALAYRSESELANSIRQQALLFYGGVENFKYVP